MVNLLKRKRKDKRIPTRLRFKIEKKVRQHNAKQRHEDRKNRSQIAKKYNKTIVLPNSCPFKEEIIKEAQETKLKDKEATIKHLKHVTERKEAARKEEEELMNTDLAAEKLEKKKQRILAHYIQSVQSRQDEFGMTDVDTTVSSNKTSQNSEQSLKAYYKEFRMVVDAADVILEVVDARDPLGTRCVQVEEAVKNARGNKKLVLVLNKADLVPSDVLKKWLDYLRKSVPAVPFKASTQRQKNNLCRRKFKSKGKMLASKKTSYSPCVGAEILMSLLKNYCRNGDVKTQIHVGIVGLPNVGKSSIINSLKRKRACSVSATPGSTRVAEVIHLDRNIKLLDSPGIVFGSSYRHIRDSDASNVLKNAVDVNKISDPIPPATAILQRANKLQMLEKYNIPEYDTPEEFFHSLAQKSGFFLKSGVPDIAKAAKELLNDWNRGKLRYYTLPPETRDEAHISAAIVTSDAPAFNVESYQENEAQFLEELDVYVQRSTSKRQKKMQTEPIIMEPSAPVHAIEFEDGLDSGEGGQETMQEMLNSDNESDSDMSDDEEATHHEEMDEDKNEKDEMLADNLTISSISAKRSKQRDGKRATGKEEKKEQTLMELEGNQKLNMLRKLAFKKQKKKQARTAKHAVSLAGVLENFSITESNEDDKYDFSTDFVHNL